jgi:tetratricopeptide (TPR) repeat protein
LKYFLLLILNLISFVMSMDLNNGELACFQGKLHWICIIKSKKNPILRCSIPYEMEQLNKDWYAIYFKTPKGMLPKINQTMFGWSLSFSPLYEFNCLSKPDYPKIPHEGDVLFLKILKDDTVYCITPFYKKTSLIAGNSVVLNSCQGYAFKILSKAKIKKDHRFVYIPFECPPTSLLPSCVNDISFGEIYYAFHNDSLPLMKKWPFYLLFGKNIDTTQSKYHVFYEGIRFVGIKKKQQALDILESLMKSCHILPLDYRIMTQILIHVLKKEKFDIIRYVQGIDQKILKILLYTYLVLYHDHKNAALLLKDMDVYHDFEIKHLKNFIQGEDCFEEKKKFLKYYNDQPDKFKECIQILFNHENSRHNYLTAGDLFYDYWIDQPASPDKTIGCIQSCEALIHGKNYDKAYQILLSIDSQDATLYYLKGLCLYHQKKYDKALAYLKKSLLPNSFQNIGYIYFDQGQWDLAREYLDKRLKLIEGILLPEEIELKKNLILLIWCCHTHKGEIDKRVTFINQHKAFLKSHGDELWGLLAMDPNPSVEQVKEHLNHLKKTVTLLKVGRSCASSGQVLIEAAKRNKSDAT